MKKLVFFLMLLPSIAWGAGAGGINLTPNQRALLSSSNTFTASQVFLSSVTFSSSTINIGGVVSFFQSTVPGSGDQILHRNAVSSITYWGGDAVGAGGSGDDLGDHKATQLINAAGFGVVGSSVYATSTGDAIFVSSFNSTMLDGYSVYAGSDSLASNSQKTIFISGVASIWFPMVCELETINTAVTSVRVKSIAMDRFVVYNADVVNAKDFIWHVFGRR